MLDDATLDAQASPTLFDGRATTPTHPELSTYARIVVFFSGGKDSVAAVLHLLAQGVDRARIELHHHNVDGGPNDPRFMDWPVTEAYCRAFAQAFGLPIYFSWKEGGFKREMQRQNAPTAPITFQTGNGSLRTTGGEGPLNTRGLFPQVTADLSQRWCSAYLKVDVGARLLTNDERFQHSRTLVVTGERAAESSARSRYAMFEHHRADRRDSARLGRHIDHWRPVHGWSEGEVWAILERHRVNPHPAYHLGWSRTSCAGCIFGSPDQWASLRAVDPEGFEQIALEEARSGKTIQRKLSIRELADRGTQYRFDERQRAIALSREYTEKIVVEHWTLPAGAFGDGAGPN